MTQAHYGYHAKHRGAAEKRASLIFEHSDSGGRFLDIGCNAGDIGLTLLRTGKASYIHGMDLDQAVVEPTLMSHPNFSFQQGDIAESDSLPEADYAVYSAVHHHVLHQHGLTAAIRCIGLIARSTERAVFFETGQISESSYWPWQSSIRKYFRTDEEHYAYLLSSLDGAISEVELLGKIRIHGVYRWFFKLSLCPRSNRPGELDSNFSASHSSSSQLYIRSWGSRKPGIFEIPQQGNVDSPCEFSCSEQTGSPLFLKRHIHRPFYSRLEYELGIQVTQPWAVQPIEFLPGTAEICFPFISHENRVGIDSIPNSDRPRLANQVSQIFQEAKDIKITLNTDSWRFRNTFGCLLDVCDINPNNVLFNYENKSIEIHIVDFEPQGTKLRYRNKLNQAEILRRLRHSPLRAFFLAIFGYLIFLSELIRGHFHPILARVKSGIPSLGSLIYAEAATFCGWRLRRLLDLLRRRGN